MNDPEYWGPFYNVWTSSQPEWEEELAKIGDDTRASFVIKARDDDRPLGTIGYITPSTLPSLFRGLEIWYQVHPTERGHGVAGRALKRWSTRIAAAWVRISAFRRRSWTATTGLAASSNTSA